MTQKLAFRSLAILAVLALIFSIPATAQWQSCKMCDWDGYDQAICVLAPCCGPEGGISCNSSQQCWDGVCYEICYTSQDCSWA